MEKAHPDVFNVLLQVLDDGRLTDGQGRQVSFKNTIVIMTSNVGSDAIAELSGTDEQEMRHRVDEAMSRTFRPEFLNRIDDIVVFHPLGMAQIERIVDIQLADVRERLARERMTLSITPAAKQMLAVGGLDPVFGARPLKRLIQREVVDAIARAIIDGRVREGDGIALGVDADGSCHRRRELRGGRRRLRGARGVRPPAPRTPRDRSLATAPRSHPPGQNGRQPVRAAGRLPYPPVRPTLTPPADAGARRKRLSVDSAAAATI